MHSNSKTAGISVTPTWSHSPPRGVPAPTGGSPILGGMELERVPVWVELVVPLIVAPIPGLDGEPSIAAANLAAIAADALPNTATIVTALTVDEVEHVMNQQAADLAATLADTRHQLKVLLGAIDNEIATPEQTMSALRNIIATIPVPTARTIPAIT
jgi:hypothetical protein